MDSQKNSHSKGKKVSKPKGGSSKNPSTPNPSNQQAYTPQPYSPYPYHVQDQASFDPFQTRYANPPYRNPTRQTTGFSEDRPLPIFDDEEEYDGHDDGNPDKYKRKYIDPQAGDYSPVYEQRRSVHVEEDEPVQEEDEPIEEDDEPVEDDDEPVEVDEETMRKGKFVNRAARQTWTVEQMEALCRAWVHCSVDPKKGNQQKKSSFWTRILNPYNEQLGGSTRTMHQLNTKWNNLQQQINSFNGYYIQAERLRASGANDLDVMKKAQKDYARKYKSDFKHVGCWEIARPNEKWTQIPRVGEDFSNRTEHKRKSSGSENFSTPSNDESFPSWAPDLNEDAAPTRPTRRAKKSADSSSSIGSLAEKVEKFASVRETMMKEFIETRKKKDEDITTLVEEQRASIREDRLDRDLKMFTDSHDHLSGMMLELVLQRKREIAARHGWPCDF